MSRTIDSRVVEMQFDNRQFESNVKTSMSTLDKLKQSLNFTGASKGLENVNTAAKNVNMSGLSEAVETVRTRFSALEVIAVTALANITNSAINTGKQLVKSLTIDQVTAGWTKYEQKTASVQTIMNATGKSIDEVNGYLDKLMWFSDETSYGFTDMTAALAQMTSSGGDIENLLPLITGVANATAYAGKGAAEFSRAMYNLNQSYSMGSLQYIDWKSLELAGIASKQLKQIFIDTGVAMGKIAEGEVTISNFGSTLKDKWADTSVMEAAFGKFSELSEEAYKLVQSGEYDTASEAMEALSGRYSDVAEKAFKAAQQAKTFTEAIDATKDAVSTGWMKTMEIIFGNIEEATVLWTDVTNALWDVFASGAEARNEMLEGWKELGGRTALIESFSNVFEALGKIITPIKEAFRDIFPAMTSERLYALTEGLKSFTEKLQIGDDTADKIKRTFKGLFAVLDMVKDAFGFVLKVAGQVFSLFGGPTAGGILELTARFGDFLVKLHDTAEAGNIFGKAFEKIQEIFTTVADKIKEAISRIGSAFQGFKSIDMGPLDEFSEKAEKRFRPFTHLGQIFGAVFEAIVKVLEWAAPIVAKLGSIIGKGLGALADKVSYAVENMEFNEILDLINTGLFGAIIYGIKKFIDSLTEITSGAGGFLDGITGILDGVRGSLEAYQSSLKAKTLFTIATAIGILAAALVVLSMIPSDKLTISLVAISALFIELSASMIVLGKTLGNVKMAKISGQLVAMATAILILSSAMKNLAELNQEDFNKGIIGVAALAATLVISANMLNKSSGKIIKGSTGLIAFSAAILILTHAVDNLAQLSWDELSKGLVGLTVILTEIVALTNLIGEPKRMISTGIGMIALGAAMLIFAEAVERMGQLSWGEIARGLITMAGALTAITVAMNLMPKGMINKATGMVVMGAALLIIAEAMSKFGDMQWGEIARGLVAMAGALTAITVAMNLMPKGMINKALGLIGVAAALQIMIGPLKEMSGMSWDEIAKGLVMLGGSLLVLTVAVNAMTGGLAGAAAMLVMAAAIRVLTPALQTLGSMNLSEIGKALLALVGVFVVVGAAGLLLAPLTPIILGLAAAIALLGVGVVAIGSGLLMFSAGLTALAVSGTAGAAALVVVVTSLISLIPMVLEKIGEGIIAFAGVITNGIPVIMEAVKQISLAFIQNLIEITPPVVEALLTFLVTLLEQLANAVPQMVDAGMRLLIGILEGIATHIQDVVVVALKLISEFLRGIAEGIPGVVQSAVDIVVAFLTAIGEETPRIIDAGFKMIINFINGLADAIRENTPALGKAMGNLAGAMIEGLVGGLTAGIKSVVDSVKNLGKNALNGLKSFLGIHSPSKEFMYLGQCIGDGLAIGIDNSIGKATKSSSKLAKEIIKYSKKTIEEFQSWIEDKKYYNEISLKEELDAWTLVQQRYKEGTEERKKADREVYRLQKELVKATYQYSIDWIEEEKYYNRLSLKEELEAWQRVQSRYMDGSEERKKADREVYRLQKELTDKKIELEKEYADTVKSINDDLKSDIQSLNDYYQNALKSRADEIYKSYGLFDKVSDPEHVSSDELIKNLNTQVDSLKTWRNTLDDLTRRGLDPKLIEELREMGPSALGELTAISNMTDEQLSKYSNLWREKHSIAESQATAELEGMRREVLQQIEQLKIEADAKLAEYTNAWNTRMAELLGIVLPTNTNIVTSTNDTMNNSIETINSKQVEYNLAGQNVASNLVAGIRAKDLAVSNTFMQIISRALTVIKNQYADFYNAGKYIVQGFANGITAYTYIVEARARAMAAAVARAAEEELDINSPSKVGYGIGSFFGLGFVNALSAYVSKSYQAGSEIAKSAKNGLSEAISKITDVIEGDIDTQPTIRPVLDLSDVESGTGRLNALFSRTQAMSISAGMNRVANEEIQNGVITSSGNTIQFTQNNYSPKALSRIEIYRQTKNQLSMMKGLVKA